LTDKRDDDERAESRRIIERVSQEADSGGRSTIDRARNHLAARDVDRDDWAEYWGTRIGRTIGAVFLVGLIVWLVLYLAQPV
jgi:hypothetical protein